MSIETSTQTVPAPAAQPRVNYSKVAPASFQAMMAFQQASNKTSLEKPLLELVKLRASLLNGCAYCIDMHVREARALGETDERLYLLAAWQEARGHYTAREQAALRWTDALTKLAGHHVEDALFAEVHAHFPDKELAELSLAIVAINGWNRLNAGFATPIRFRG